MRSVRGQLQWLRPERATLHERSVRTVSWLARSLLPFALLACTTGHLQADGVDARLAAAKAALGEYYGSIRTLRVEYDYVSVLKPESRQPKEKIGKPNALRMAYWIAGEQRRVDQLVPDGEFAGRPGLIVSYDGSKTYIA
jgi:hypothetical protein